MTLMEREGLKEVDVPFEQGCCNLPEIRHKSRCCGDGTGYAEKFCKNCGFVFKRKQVFGQSSYYGMSFGPDWGNEK